MKRILLFVIAFFAFGLFAEAQRPTGQVVSGSTSSGSNTTILVDSNGVVQTATSSGTVNNDNISQVAGQGVATNGNGVLAVAGPASSGLIVALASCSGSTCYTSPVNAGATVIASGSTSIIFASTTSIDPGSFCTNSTASAVTLTATDGNNVPFLGTTTFGASFSIPALSRVSFNDIAGSIFTSGIRMSASVASSITCWIRGHQ